MVRIVEIYHGAMFCLRFKLLDSLGGLEEPQLGLPVAAFCQGASTAAVHPLFSSIVCRSKLRGETVSGTFFIPS